MQKIDDCKEKRLALTRAGIATRPEKCLRTFRLVVTAQHIYHNLLKRPLADDVPSSRDHSQNVLATARVFLHSHLFCFPIALSARATTRRRRLLEISLADRSSQRRACARQHYDNDNSQWKPRDFGWKVRGARRISRE
jgi:hypothetical protein